LLYGSLVCGVTLAGLHIFEAPVRLLLTSCCVLPVFFMLGSTLCLIAVILKNLYFIPLSFRLTGVLRICDLWFIGLHFILLWSRQLKQDMQRGYFCFSGGSERIWPRKGALLISNHCNSQLDWMNAAELMWSMGSSPSHLKGFMKSAFQYIPFVGWVGVLMGSIILSRTWKKDKTVISSALKDRVYNWPSPNYFAMYPEGTRITRKKLLDAQKFARERGLIELRHLLQPRVKGFIATLKTLRDLKYTHIIDVTAVPSPRAMDFKELLFGKFHTSHAYIKATMITSIPESDEDIKAWLRNEWVQKDALIQARKDGQIWKGVEKPFLNYYYSSSALWTVHAILCYKILSFLVAPLVAVTWASGASVCIFYVLMRSHYTSAMQDPQKLDLKTE